jgi:glycosyltransferase involved in cell wall biosynthesis
MGSFELSGSGIANAPSQPSRAGLVSVVIPCFRQAQFLSDAIDSVLKQSHRDFEIVVVDDGSPDDVAVVARRYEAVRCIRQENRGQAAARNAGLRVSRGEFVVFLDADDRLLPNALEIGLSRLSALPECGLTFGRVRYIATDGSPLCVPRTIPIDGDYYRAFLEHGNFINTPAAAMFRRDALERVDGFDERLRGGEDYELYLRIVRTTSASPHSEVVAERRRHGDSSTTRPLQRLPSLLAIYQKHREYVRGDPESERAYRIGLRRMRAATALRLVAEIWSNVKRGERRQAIRGVTAIVRHPEFAWYAGRGIVSKILNLHARGSGPKSRQG